MWRYLWHIGNHRERVRRLEAGGFSFCLTRTERASKPTEARGAPFAAILLSKCVFRDCFYCFQWIGCERMCMWRIEANWISACHPKVVTDGPIDGSVVLLPRVTETEFKAQAHHSGTRCMSIWQYEINLFEFVWHVTNSNYLNFVLFELFWYVLMTG